MSSRIAVRLMKGMEDGLGGVALQADEYNAAVKANLNLIT